MLAAAAELLDEKGFNGFSVDEVARRSGVSKATIYKHWPDGVHVAVEAYGSLVTEVMPTPSTGDVIADLTEQVRRVAAVYSGRRGTVIAQLLAAGIGAQAPGLLWEKFFATRWQETVATIRSGIDDGLLRSDLDPDLAISLLFGPIVFRLFNGRPPLDAADAAALADLALNGLIRTRP